MSNDYEVVYSASTKAEWRPAKWLCEPVGDPPARWMLYGVRFICLASIANLILEAVRR